MAGAYTYKPLRQADAIRLLILEPSRSRDSHLAGALVNTTLAECDYDLVEPYTALSYVWGDPQLTKGSIHLQADDEAGGSDDDQDGIHAYVEASITANLENALRDLRDEKRPRRVWADALCIDQQNIPERNQQVSLMRLIYRTAHHTVVHLGAATPLAEKVLRVAAPPPANGSNVSETGLSHAEAVEAAQKDLLVRPWFRRVWIFQELVLSKDPWVQCGTKRVRWSRFCGLLLADPLRQAVASPMPSPGSSGPDSLQVLADMNWAHIQSSTPVGLFRLLQMRRGFGATDPRDMIYAHLGLAADRAEAGRYIQVDYAKPAAKLYAETARYILVQNGLEKLLSFAGDSEDGSESSSKRRLAGLPSWAPDWRLIPSYRRQMYKDNLLSRRRLEGRHHAFAAGGDILAAVGYQVDVIEHLSAVLPQPSSLLERETVARAVETYRQVVKDLSALYGSKGGVYYSGDTMGQHVHISFRGAEEQNKALCLALCAEWIILVREAGVAAAGAESSSHDDFVDFLSKWAKKEAESERIFIGVGSRGMPQLMFSYQQPGRAETKVFQGRRLASTTAGRCGVVPPQARQGDFVVNLANSETAYVVRPAAVPEGGEESIGRPLPELDMEIRAAILEGDGELLGEWDAARSGVVHGEVIGECYLDGQVGWMLMPEEREYKIFALH